MNPAYIIVIKFDAQSGQGYAVVQLNRPDVLNAINIRLMDELVHALEVLDADDEVKAIILTGNDKVFAAGADIKEMADASSIDMLIRDQFARWDRIRNIRKPIIAAVSGFALGGGCELAMACDMIIASESAKFGQPEINIGVIPGAGGTQRLTRALGKSKAMDMILTGRLLGAEDAFRSGLVMKVVPVECYFEEAKALAREIASKPPLAVRMAKEAILKSFDATLDAGMEFERKNFYMLFASGDQKEGMKAFVEKRKPEWRGR